MATELPGSGEHERDDDGDRWRPAGFCVVAALFWVLWHGAIIGPSLFRPCFCQIGLGPHFSVVFLFDPCQASLFFKKKKLWDGLCLLGKFWEVI
jgi:hypothetical protein